MYGSLRFARLGAGKARAREAITIRFKPISGTQVPEGCRLAAACKGLTTLTLSKPKQFSIICVLLLPLPGCAAPFYKAWGPQAILPACPMLIAGLRGQLALCNYHPTLRPAFSHSWGSSYFVRGAARAPGHTISQRLANAITRLLRAKQLELRAKGSRLWLQQTGYSDQSPLRAVCVSTWLGERGRQY